MGLAQYIALAPDSIDIHASGTCKFKFPAQFAHKDVNDLWLWLYKTATEMAEEGCLAQHRAFAQGRKLDNAEFFGRQRHLSTVNQGSDQPPDCQPRRWPSYVHAFAGQWHRDWSAIQTCQKVSSDSHQPRHPAH